MVIVLIAAAVVVAAGVVIVVMKKKKVNKERLNEVMNDYPFIFDKSQKLEDKIVYFIKKRYEYDISPDHVIDILYDDKKEEA